MARKTPVTNAIRVLRDHNVPFEVHEYRYEPRGGTRVSSRELGVDEHTVIKTLIFEDDSQSPFVVLMHGDLEVSAREVARVLGVKSVQPCEARVADRHSGYQVGGTSPFGLRRAMPILAQRTIADLATIYLNGGRRGMLVALSPAALGEVLQVQWADIASA